MNRNKEINNFVKTMVEKKVSLAIAESMTCGLAAHMLSTCKGTAEMFLGSVVCYNEKVKTEMLGVPKSQIKKYTAESKQVTETLSKKLTKLITADIYASITGLASAGGSETSDKPVGTVFYSIIYNKKVYNFRRLFRGTPLQIREKACLTLYDIILKEIID